MGGYLNQRTRRWANTEPVLLVPSAAQAKNTTASAAFELGDRHTLRLALAVAAVAGNTPTLDVTLQTSKDGGVLDAWRTLGTFTQRTSADLSGGASPVPEQKCFAGCDRFVRASSVVGGVQNGSIANFDEAGTGTVAVASGLSTGAHTYALTISKGGARNTAEFTYTVDGGAASAAILIPTSGSVVLPGSGLTLLFGAGTYVQADVASFSSYAVTSFTFSIDGEAV